jgi:hypothetical protein
MKAACAEALKSAPQAINMATAYLIILVPLVHTFFLGVNHTRRDGLVWRGDLSGSPARVYANPSALAEGFCYEWNVERWPKSSRGVIKWISGFGDTPKLAAAGNGGLTINGN